MTGITQKIKTTSAGSERDGEDNCETVSCKRKRGTEDKEECTTFVTPVKLKSSVGSRSAFKAPFKSPLISANSPAAAADARICARAPHSPAVSGKLDVKLQSALRHLGGSPAGKKTSSTLDPVALKTKVLELRAKEVKLDGLIAALEGSGLNEKDLQNIMNQTHDYNDLKDAAQTTCGRLAIVRQCTIRDVYKDIGLDLDD